MARLPLRTPEDAPEEARDRLLAAQKNNGFLPNLVRLLANAPTALETYQVVSGINGRAGLTLAEREAVQITAAATLDDDLNGTVELDIDGIARRFEIAPPSGPGDGTVPVESGEAPRPHVVQSFRHRGRLAGHQPYEHQSAFEAREPLGCTLYAIARIAATSPWFQAQLAEIQGTHQDAP